MKAWDRYREVLLRHHRTRRRLYIAKVFHGRSEQNQRLGHDDRDVHR